MLVLSRQVYQRIVIGDSIVLTVTRIEGNQVRIGIEAPPDVPIIREELLPNSDLLPDAPPLPERLARLNQLAAAPLAEEPTGASEPLKSPPRIFRPRTPRRVKP
jgi:carbon storage regulator